MKRRAIYSGFLFALYSFAALSAAALSATAQEWPRFRGVNGQGGSDAKGIPTSWTESDYAWKASLPGIGHSSPSLWGEKLFVLSADPRTATRYVVCLNADDGKQIWRREF